MKRLLSMTLLLLFGSSLLVPLFAPGADANLPVCCRKNGAHHCLGMSAMAASGQTAAIGARCSRYPKTVATAGLHPVFLGSSQRARFELAAKPSRQLQENARFHIDAFRSGQNRGPPEILLL